MPRFRLTIEYDGTSYAGWQSQANGPSIQARLEAAVTAFTGEQSMVQGAGRTDAGVHALGQVAHVDLSRDWSPNVVQNALNAQLRPDPIVILGCVLVPDDFQARFDATGRHYLYRILNRRAPPALDAARVWHWMSRLDAEAMHQGAQLLLGQHDFTTYRSAHCQAKSPVKTLDRLDVSRRGDEIHIAASARSFMHNQVRSMVGCLKLVGEGRWQPIRMATALAARDRSECGMVAPPEGLYLMRVDYDGRRSDEDDEGS
jgi:tRNA pseudouridine38-40 synthase